MSVKKSGGFALLAIMLVFLSFTAGFFVGRNFSGSQVSTQVLVSVQGTVSNTVQDEASSQHPASSETGAEAAVTTGANTAVSTQSTAGLININTANLSDLQTLPGIGAVIGQRIIDYRTENGPFTSVYDLINVKGIGEKRLEQMLPYVTIGG